MRAVQRQYVKRGQKIALISNNLNNFASLLVLYLIAILTDIHPELHFQITEKKCWLLLLFDAGRYLNTNHNFILSTAFFLCFFHFTSSNLRFVNNAILALSLHNGCKLLHQRMDVSVSLAVHRTIYFPLQVFFSPQFDLNCIFFAAHASRDGFLAMLTYHRKHVCNRLQTVPINTLMQLHKDVLS